MAFALAWCLAALPTSQDFDKRIAAALKAWDVPGVSVAIVTPERVIYLKGHGVAKLGGPAVSPATVFPLASCSKAFTTALMAKLVDEGKLHWDDPVRKHLPEFRLSDPAADSLVTLRDLVSHRTGVASHDLLWYRATWSQAEMIRRVGHLPLSRPFRTELQYQSVMFIAAGEASARAGEKPWADLLRDRILKPLGMKDVALTTTEAEKRIDRSAGHKADSTGKLVPVPWYPQPEPNAAGSVHASARDLVPWLQFQLTGGRLGEVQVVSEASLRETQSPQTIVRLEGSARATNPDTHQLSYGLAWVVQDYRGRLVVQHTGLIDGFRAHITLLPKDGYALAILANREGTRLNLALSNTLVDLLLGLPTKDWNSYLREVMDDERTASQLRARREDLARQPDLVASVPEAKLAGLYEQAAFGKATIRADKDGLVWEWGVWKLKLEPYAGNTYRLRSDDERLDRAMLEFQIKDGAANGFLLQGLTFARADR